MECVLQVVRRVSLLENMPAPHGFGTKLKLPSLWRGL